MTETKHGFKTYLLLYIVPALAAFLQLLYFYIINCRELGPGFPIDDAYIFRQYAENLAGGHGFVFNLGEPSFGGTSLVWPVFIAAVLRLFGNPAYVPAVFWTGGALFILTAVLAAFIVKRACGTALPAMIAGLLVAASPLLFMNAVSGMETPLTMFLVAAFAAVALKHSPRPALAGAVAGLYTLNRPEGLYFPVGFLIAWLVLLLFAKKRPAVGPLAKFFAGWAILALPAALWIYMETGSPLPTTYMGKIMSTSPGELDRGLGPRLVAGLFSLGSGWIKLSLRLRALSLFFAAGILWETVRVLRGLRQEGSTSWPALGKLVLLGYLFLPLAYGLSFPVGPEFGGYYIRYIAPVLVPVIILGTTGCVAMARDIKGRQKTLEAWYRPVAAIAGLVVLAYGGWLWSFQIAYAKTDYKREVRLNTGIRMEAARWLKQNTPEDARIMAGYTGLGVIGACSDRYVLDQGALINPDIFDYYRKAGAHPRKKWKMVVRYMHDKDLDYYVTFAFPADLAELYPDPANTPGFREVKRLGKKDRPVTRLSQIRIYKADWDEWEEENEKER